MEWVKCSDVMPPPNMPVLAYVPSYQGGGNSRRIRAQYAPPGTLELSGDCDDDEGYYDEETDTFYCSPGWYEDNEYEEIHWRVDDEVTHWMPLPDPPSNSAFERDAAPASWLAPLNADVTAERPR